VNIVEKWVLSANPNYFNHKDAFATWGFIDWKQTRKFVQGDIVYIYVTKPVSRIAYKTRVIQANMTENDVSDMTPYWIKQPPVEKAGTKYARLALVCEYKDDRFPFSELQKHGMPYAPQSPCKVKPELERYLGKEEENDNE
jgi:hypothetical protein